MRKGGGAGIVPHTRVFEAVKQDCADAALISYNMQGHNEHV